MILDAYEINSPLWDKITVHYNAQLVDLRERLESTACPDKEREHICWRIQEIKKLLSFGEEPKDKISGSRRKLPLSNSAA